jgi:hypothetical protein
MDVAEDRLMTGKKMMALLVKDEATSFGLSITLRRSCKVSDVEAVLNELVAQHGTPKNIRSDNGGPFIATIVQQ